jgi:hypothetical protein
VRSPAGACFDGDFSFNRAGACIRTSMLCTGQVRFWAVRRIPFATYDLLNFRSRRLAVRNDCSIPPFYSHTGRPSIDPELMVRMLIVGYCFGIRSEEDCARKCI